jgi:hypothetical protein
MKEWILRNKTTKATVKAGDTITCRDETTTLTEGVGHPPRHDGSTGRIWVANKEFGMGGEVFPHVFDLEWIEQEADDTPTSYIQWNMVDRYTNLNRIYSDYKGGFKAGGFHSALWEIIIKRTYDSNILAFAALHNGQLVLADGEDQGFYPTDAFFTEKANQSHILNELNREIFALNNDEAWKITGESMDPGGGPPGTHCDSCMDDLTVDCHDCEQYQQNATRNALEATGAV